LEQQKCNYNIDLLVAQGVFDHYYVQKRTILSGDVYFDETYYPLETKNLTFHASELKLRGIAKNLLCIGATTDGEQTFLIAEGIGRASGLRTLESFSNHIMPGSMLIHDSDPTHNKLIKEY
jgi:hypothetical protein